MTAVYFSESVLLEKQITTTHVFNTTNPRRFPQSRRVVLKADAANKDKTPQMNVSPAFIDDSDYERNRNGQTFSAPNGSASTEGSKSLVQEVSINYTGLRAASPPPIQQAQRVEVSRPIRVETGPQITTTFQHAPPAPNYATHPQYIADLSETQTVDRVHESGRHETEFPVRIAYPASPLSPSSAYSVPVNRAEASRRLGSSLGSLITETTEQHYEAYSSRTRDMAGSPTSVNALAAQFEQTARQQKEDAERTARRAQNVVVVRPSPTYKSASPKSDHSFDERVHRVERQVVLPPNERAILTTTVVDIEPPGYGRRSATPQNQFVQEVIQEQYHTVKTYTPNRPANTGVRVVPVEKVSHVRESSRDSTLRADDTTSSRAPSSASSRVLSPVRTVVERFETHKEETSTERRPPMIDQIRQEIVMQSRTSTIHSDDDGYHREQQRREEERRRLQEEERRRAMLGSTQTTTIIEEETFEEIRIRRRRKDKRQDEERLRREAAEREHTKLEEELRLRELEEQQRIAREDERRRREEEIRIQEELHYRRELEVIEQRERRRREEEEHQRREIERRELERLEEERIRIEQEAILVEKRRKLLADEEERERERLRRQHLEEERIRQHLAEEERIRELEEEKRRREFEDAEILRLQEERTRREKEEKLRIEEEERKRREAIAAMEKEEAERQRRKKELEAAEKLRREEEERERALKIEIAEKEKKRKEEEEQRRLRKEEEEREKKRQDESRRRMDEIRRQNEREEQERKRKEEEKRIEEERRLQERLIIEERRRLEEEITIERRKKEKERRDAEEQEAEAERQRRDDERRREAERRRQEELRIQEERLKWEEWRRQEEVKREEERKRREAEMEKAKEKPGANLPSKPIDLPPTVTSENTRMTEDYRSTISSRPNFARSGGFASSTTTSYNSPISGNRMVKIVNEVSSSTLSGMSPFGQHAASSIRDAREREKKEMSDLNDRLASYIEKVRFLEAQNRKLQSDLDLLRSRWGKDTSSIRTMYESEIREAQKLIGDTNRQRDDLEKEIRKLMDEVSNFRRLYEQALREHNGDRVKIEDLLEKLSKIEADINLLKRKITGAEEEVSRIKKENQRMLGELQRARQDIDQETLNRIDYHNQVQTLVEEIDFMKRVNDQEIRDLQAMASRDTTTENREYFKNELSSAIRDIRQEYDQLMQLNRNDMESWYKLKVQEISTSSAKVNMEQGYAKEEVKRLRVQLGDLRGKLADLEGRNSLLEKQTQELNYQLEDDQRSYESALNDRDSQIRKMREECQALMVELQMLLDTKQTLDAEIAIYRKMLEGEENRAGLRQLVEQVVKTTGLTHSEEHETLRTLKSETSSRTSFQRSAKGNVSIQEAGADGKSIVLENTHRSREEDIGGWKLKRKIDGKREIVYTFPSKFTLRPQKTVKIFARGQGVANGLDVLVHDGDDTFGTGSNVHTTLYNLAGEERATLIQRSSRD